MYVPKMLNGWKRIGIILSVFWILVAYGVTYMSTLDLGGRRPNEEDALIAFFPVPLALGVRLPHFVSCALCEAWGGKSPRARKPACVVSSHATVCNMLA